MKFIEVSSRLVVREVLEATREADVMDEILSVQAREAAAKAVSDNTALWHQIEAALKRIEAGTFGMCPCGERIHGKRLGAVPWSPLCRRCADAEEAEKTA